MVQEHLYLRIATLEFLYLPIAYWAQIVVLKMGQPSFEASNAVIYVTYGAFLYGLDWYSFWRNIALTILSI